jgi:hypothetical protein
MVRVTMSGNLVRKVPGLAVGYAGLSRCVSRASSPILAAEVAAMLVKGDVKCLHCGHISGQWVGPNGAPLTVTGFSSGEALSECDSAALLRCARCEGPVFLDDAGLVISSYRIRRIRRLREQIAALDARRRRVA